MPTRVYFPSSGAAEVTPASFQFAEQINPLTFAGKLFPSGTAMTNKVEATGVVSPIFRAMLRYVVSPLKAVTISGTVRGQIGGAENNAAANANVALAIKVIQPNGADRGVLLAPAASDLASAPHEFNTVLTNTRFQNANEVPTIPLTQQSALDGNYLSIELGFRAATTTTRNITLRYGDAAADLPEDFSTTVDLNPWLEFSSTLELQISLDAIQVQILGGSVCSGGSHRTVQTNFGNYELTASEILNALPDTFEERKRAVITNLRDEYFKRLALGMNSSQAIASVLSSTVEVYI